MRGARRWRWSRAPALGVLAVLLGQGCGTGLPLPHEVARDRVIPADQSYQVLDVWDTNMQGIRDLLLTQGSGQQLFLLFNDGGSGTAPRGRVEAYPLTRDTPIPGIGFATLFNPVALSAGGNRVFILDQGDTCLARANPNSGACNDTTGNWNLRVSNLGLYWRVREFTLVGGDTISTFTDTTLAFVQGIAADAEGNVYVSGTHLVFIRDQENPSLLTRTTQFRVFKYKRGPSSPGVPDHNMPGANWHRDPTFEIEEGSGVGTVVDPRGLAWGPAGGAALYAADFGKNWVQKLSDRDASVGFWYVDGAESGRPFNGPEDVSVDLRGYVYVADTGNRRVMRFDPDAGYVQDVNVEGPALQLPIAVAANDSLAYVVDSGVPKVIRYKRRS